MLKRQKPDEPIEARTINRPIEILEGLLASAVTSGFNASGYNLALAQDRPFTAKLSGSTSPYSWSEVYGTAGGGWAVLAGARTGTTNAYEYNGKTGLNNKIATLKPFGPSIYRFAYNRKHSGTTVITWPTPFCPCATTPAVLTMVSLAASCMNGILQSDTLRYQTTPAVYTPLHLGPTCWLGDGSFTDPDSLDSFQYHFACQPGFFTLSRVFATSIYGSPYRDIVRYSWPMPLPGNACSPFSLTNGFAFRGGDATCQVHITE